MKPDDHTPPQASSLDDNSNPANSGEHRLTEVDRIIRQIVKRATNTSAVLESIVEQWNSYQHDGLNE